VRHLFRLWQWAGVVLVNVFCCVEDNRTFDAAAMPKKKEEKKEAYGTLPSILNLTPRRLEEACREYAGREITLLLFFVSETLRVIHVYQHDHQR
jgi:hypothetical protein